MSNKLIKERLQQTYDSLGDLIQDINLSDDDLDFNKYQYALLDIVIKYIENTQKRIQAILNTL